MGSAGGWSIAELIQLRRHARLMGTTFDLARLADFAGRPAGEVNQALNALSGRTPAEAALALRAGGQGARGQGPGARGQGPGARAATRPSSAIKRFLREVFQ